MKKTQHAKILSHRGITMAQLKENSFDAFSAALEQGFGLETDLRDLDGEIVISHDPPTHSSQPQTLKNFVKLVKEKAQPGVALALNIKSDGIQDKVYDEVKQLNSKSYFCFDMSIPDSLRYLKRPIPTFGRMSEYEPLPVNERRYSGIWLDAFTQTWFSAEQITHLLDKFKSVAIVSPELHKREHQPLWEMLSHEGFLKNPNIMICTDYPNSLLELINESN